MEGRGDRTGDLQRSERIHLKKGKREAKKKWLEPGSNWGLSDCLDLGILAQLVKWFFFVLIYEVLKVWRRATASPLRSMRRHSYFPIESWSRWYMPGYRCWLWRQHTQLENSRSLTFFFFPFCQKWSSSKFLRSVVARPREATTPRGDLSYILGSIGGASNTQARQ